MRRTTANVVFFWDYDTQWGADRSRSPGGPKHWGPLEFGHTERLLELHAQYNIPACFAVVGAAALPGERPYHDPEQIRRIHAAGHEIASHSFSHDWLPALGPCALRETLRRSKDAIEQCIGAPVLSFVPPYNQPFDYLRGLSISLSERRSVRHDRTDLRRLCDALRECGYRFCRVSYRPLWQRLVERMLRKRLHLPLRPVRIAGVTCLRLTTTGFDRAAAEALGRAVRRGGFVAISGHPHSLHSGNPQDEKHLVPLLRQISQLRGSGCLQVLLPRDLTQTTRV